MTTYSETDLDRAARFRDQLEESGAAASPSKSTTLAIVTVVDGEKVTMVTQCKPRERGDWLDQLGRETAEDIDARWGMAWVDSQGSIQHAGPDLVFAIEAIAQIQTQQFSSDGLTALGETNDEETEFAIVGENDEGIVRERVPVRPGERALALELYGFDTTGSDPWAIAWQPDGAPIMTTGNHIGSACRAVLDLVRS